MTSRNNPARTPSSGGPRNTNSLAAIQALLEATTGAEKFIDVLFHGHTLRFHYHELSWTAKSRCISTATIYGTKVNPVTKQEEVTGSFRLDIYNKQVLKEILVDPPIPITENLLDRLPSEVGEQFETIIPNPFGSLEVAEQQKKDSAASSEEAA